MTTHPIEHTRSTTFIDTRRYHTADTRDFRGDPIIEAAATFDDLAALAASPHWEDRVRAEVVHRALTVTLPDQFPCIYERADSPNNLHGRGAPGPLSARHAWVIAPNSGTLEETLPLYQELWDAYTSQWGPSARRTFAVGRLDGLRPTGVYRPDARPEDIIAATFLTHDGMYQRAPEHLRAMHPQHANWTANR